MKKIRIKEQEDVLNINSGNAVVSASAGSGKTSVMVEKIIKYVFSGVSVKNILALTFTNQAATELKTRLEKVFGEKIDKENRFELADEIDSLPQADISTFHSFYEKIVKKYFYIIGLNSSFEILSNEERKSLSEKAFLKAVDKYKLLKLNEYNLLIDALGKKRSNKPIKEIIFKLDEFCSSQFDFKKWLSEKAGIMFEKPEETLSIFFSEVFFKVNQTIRKFEQSLSLASGNGDDALCQHINLCIGELNTLLLKNFKEVYSNIYKFKFPLVKQSVNKQTDCFILTSEIKEDFKEFLNSFKNSNFGSFEDILKSFETCKLYIGLLVDFYFQFKEILNFEKKELNKFDFSDLELMCYQILSNPKIQQEIKSKYIKIFVDEFQDINPIQFEILKLVSSNNVLFVGDAKQSIYAFRQSDVDIFVETCKQFEKDENSKALVLRSNFRSNPKILNFANEVFNVLMTEKTSGINYESTSQFEPKSENDCEGGSVEILCFEDQKEKKQIQVEKIATAIGRDRVFKDISQEARIIAGKVSQLISEKIKINNTIREINFGDIAILFKNRSELLYDLTKIFKEYNIPYLVNDEVDLLEVKEIKQLVSLINLCFNFNNDTLLAPMLCSYFGKISYDELAKIKLENNDEYFYEDVENYSKCDEIFVKLKMFKDLIETLSFEIQIFGVRKGLEKLIRRTNFENYVLTLEQGEEKVEYVKQFLKYIENCGENNSLVGMVEYLNSLSSIKIPSLKKCDNNSVVITTIHASKGLEYPVVILADCGKDFLRGKPEKYDLKIDKELGLAIKNYDSEKRIVYDSIFQKIIKNKLKQKEIAENLRLLYVAITRAKNKLVLTGKLTGKVDEILKSGDLLGVSTNYLSYVLAAISNKTIEGVLIDKNVQFQKKVEFDNKDYDIEYLEKEKYCLDFKYPNQENVGITLKTSVSQILKESEAGEKVVDCIEDFSIFGGGEFSTAEQGNLIHLILEKVDFQSNTLKQDIIELIDKTNSELIDKDLLFRQVLKNIELINNLLPKQNKIYKEKEFMLFESPFNIFGEGTKEKLLIQGKVDLISIGQRNVLIDYKYTGIKDKTALISKYKNQLIAYSYAIEKSLGKPVDEIYILSLKQFELIKIK